MKHIPTFQQFINESAITMGIKAKKFNKMVDNFAEDFNDAESLEDNGKLPKEYYAALKTLKIQPADAMVCFAASIGDSGEMLDAAKKSGLEYIEVEDPETGDAAIVFSKNQ